MRNLIVVVVFAFYVSGCAYYMTPRPPIMERKMGSPLSESVGVMATAADYRVVYVQIKAGSPICAEPSPDAAGQFAAAVAAALSANPADRPLGVEAQASLAVSMKQLFKRSQGVQWYRDGLSILCIARFNGWVSDEFYAQELMRIRHDAVELIRLEIPYLEKVTIDPVAVPGWPTPIEKSGAAK